MNVKLEAPESMPTKGLSFLPMAGCPMCGDDLDIHERLDIIGKVATSPVGESEGGGQASIVGCDRMVCAWFAKCTNYATHTEVLPWGYVPACDQCPQIGR